MKCTGGTVRITVNGLGAFQNSFHGVVFDPRCAKFPCLLTFCGDSAVTISHSIITRVFIPSWERRFVLCAVDTARMVFRNSTISRNGATAVALGHRAWVQLLGSTLAGNACFGGAGAIHAEDSSTLIITESTVSGNVAVNTSAAVVVEEDAVLVLSGRSRVVNNTSTHGGAGVAVASDAHALIQDGSSVCNNTSVSSGGGIVVAGHGQLAVVDSVVCNNTSGHGGGGMIVGENGMVTIVDSSISNNIAVESGGGIAVVDAGYVAVYNSTIANDTCLAASSASLGGGGVAAVENATICLFNGTRVVSNSAVGLHGGGFVADEASSLTIGAGVLLSGNIALASISRRLVPYGADGVADGSSRLDIQPGVLGGHGGALTKCSRSIVLMRRPCGVGEFDPGDVGPCACCPAATYSYEANATACQQCPAHAQCLGGDVVIPAVGYWHSSQKSLQMHRCPVPSACQQPETGSCSPGYSGNVCGACSAGWGTTSPLRCGKCTRPGLQLGLYVLLVCVTVLFVTTTVHFTWHDNKAGDRSLHPSDCITVLVRFLQYLVILGSISVPWPAFLAGTIAAATAVFGVGSGQALSLDCWLPHYVPSRLPLALQRQLSVLCRGAGCGNRLRGADECDTRLQPGVESMLEAKEESASSAPAPAALLEPAACDAAGDCILRVPHAC